MIQTVDFQSFKPLAAVIPVVSSKLTSADWWNAVKLRWGIGRDRDIVTPGLYKVGNATSQSDIFVSANYRLSFNVLRKNLTGMDAWILVIDTKGINVWCAAGKGTFGTESLVRSIEKSSLKDLVKHRTVIVPQLGATGVAAHSVKEKTGFRVVFGPVRAADIPEFIKNGLKTTPEMRKITFPFYERAKLIPVDLIQAKYKLLAVLAILFFFSGLDKSGFIFAKMFDTSLFPILNIITGLIAGIVLTPLFLPFVPFRAFALKGGLWGILTILLLNIGFQVPLFERIGAGMMGLAIASFMAMNFTGSSTYTSLSGVKREMKWALPFQIGFASVGFLLFILSKLI